MKVSSSNRPQSYNQPCWFREFCAPSFATCCVENFSLVSLSFHDVTKICICCKEPLLVVPHCSVIHLQKGWCQGRTKGATDSRRKHSTSRQRNLGYYVLGKFRKRRTKIALVTPLSHVPISSQNHSVTIPTDSHSPFSQLTIDVGTGGNGGMCPLDFAINKEVPFLFCKNGPFFFRKKCPRSVVPPKFEMLPTFLQLTN